MQPFWILENWMKLWFCPKTSIFISKVWRGQASWVILGFHNESVDILLIIAFGGLNCLRSIAKTHIENAMCVRSNIVWKFVYYSRLSLKYILKTLNIERNIEYVESAQRIQHAAIENCDNKLNAVSGINHGLSFKKVIILYHNSWFRRNAQLKIIV